MVTLESVRPVATPKRGVCDGHFNHGPLREDFLALRALSAGAGCFLGVRATSCALLIDAFLLARRVSPRV